MLQQLYIKNFTLIDELNIRFHEGFSVITGETGAGKSIILGALGLLLGNRADIKAIKAGKDRCSIEAHFNISRYNMQAFFTDNDIDYDAEDCILRREINTSGKSRAFINDIPVALNVMRELGERLVDIHSQHQNLLLNKEDFQLGVVDIIADNQQQRADYEASFLSLSKARKQLEQQKSDIEKNRENEDFLRFQQKELSDAKLMDGEQEALEQEADTLSHAEEIKGVLYEADNMLTGEEKGIVEQLKGIAYKLSEIAKVYPATNELSNRLNSSYIEIKDISQDITSNMEHVEFDPAQLDHINERLDTLYTLQHKFHAESAKELLDILLHLNEQLLHIDNSDEELRERQQQVSLMQSNCEQKAHKLSATRKQAIHKIEDNMKKRLIPLGIPNVRFQVQMTQKPLAIEGTDKVSFLFSANKSTPLQPVSQVASGGEIARVMLSLKAMISGAVKLPTIIFDEIDTGVSGRVAEKMAQIMLKMGQNDRQVISITHLPQIAALGTYHYKVSKVETKEGTVSRMNELPTSERVIEIAQMLSGSNVSDAAIENARSLLHLPDESKK